MTTSAHGAAGPSFVDEYDLLAQEAPALAWSAPDDAAADDWRPPDQPVHRAPFRDASLLDSSPDTWGDTSPSASEGLTGRGLILTAAMAAGGCALLDLALTSGRMTFFFDLCFVVICLVATMAVRRDDLFTAGVLPPLLFAGVIAVVAVAAPDAFESAPGVNKVFLSGLASHASGLVGGYAVALLAVAARMTASDTRSD